MQKEIGLVCGKGVRVGRGLRDIIVRFIGPNGVCEGLSRSALQWWTVFFKIRQNIIRNEKYAQLEIAV